MTAHVLPVQPTPFVGRTDELTEIASLLSDPTCRLLTMIGPGGTGKTRLALEAASNQIATYANGVFFVPLQPVSSPTFIIPAIADALSFQLFQDYDAQRQLLNYLRDKQLLLVLDNFEHLLEGTEVVSAILNSTPHVRIMVTSREPLQLQEEWRYAVSGLSFPHCDEKVKAEQYTAVQLFAQSARRLRADFSLKRELSGVIRICRLVEGIPLGLELAASWVRVLSCQEIAGEIELGLDILETPMRNVEQRHRCMRTVLDQSWQRLTNVEQTVFKKLAVFRGGCNLEALQVVADASLRSIATLMDMSFLQRNELGRYRLHELLREYAEEKLSATPSEEIKTRDRHCMYYAYFLNSQRQALQGWGQKVALQSIDYEIENIRAAWDWAISHRKVSEIDLALDSLSFYYDTRGWYQEGEQALDRAVRLLSGHNQDDAEGVTLGRIMARQGWLCTSLAIYEKAKLLFEGSIAVLERHDARSDMAFTWLQWGELMMRTLGTDAARACYEKSLPIYRRFNDDWGVASSLNGLGHTYLFAFRFAEAKQVVSESLAMHQQLGDLHGQLRDLHFLSLVSYQLEHFHDSLQFARDLLSLSEELGVPWATALALQDLGLATYALGERSLAEEYAFRALKLTSDYHILPFTIHELVRVTRFIADAGDKVRAAALLSLVTHHPAYWLPETVEPEVTRLKAMMSPAEFRVAWQRGTTMDLDVEVEMLLEEWQRRKGRKTDRTCDVPIQPLTERENEILHLISNGLSNLEIANTLVLALSTVKWYLNQIYTKLHVKSRTQALARARELNLLD